MCLGAESCPGIAGGLTGTRRHSGVGMRDPPPCPNSTCQALTRVRGRERETWDLTPRKSSNGGRNRKKPSLEEVQPACLQPHDKVHRDSRTSCGIAALPAWVLPGLCQISPAVFPLPRPEKLAGGLGGQWGPPSQVPTGHQVQSFNLSGSLPSQMIPIPDQGDPGKLAGRPQA